MGTNVMVSVTFVPLNDTIIFHLKFLPVTLKLCNKFIMSIIFSYQVRVEQTLKAEESRGYDLHIPLQIEQLTTTMMMMTVMNLCCPCIHGDVELRYVDVSCFTVELLSVFKWFPVLPNDACYFSIGIKYFKTVRESTFLSMDIFILSKLLLDFVLAMAFITSDLQCLSKAIKHGKLQT